MKIGPPVHSRFYNIWDCVLYAFFQGWCRGPWCRITEAQPQTARRSPVVGLNQMSEVFWNFPLHYFIFESITLKAFTMTIVDGAKCKTCFGCPRMVLCGPWKTFFEIGIWFTVTLKNAKICNTDTFCICRSLTLVQNPPPMHGMQYLGFSFRFLSQSEQRVSYEIEISKFSSMYPTISQD